MSREMSRRTLPDTAAQPADKAGSKTATRPPSKLAEVARVLAEPEILELEKEYRLFVHVLLNSGEAIGTAEQLGKTLGTKVRNIKNWIEKLDEAGMITVERLEHRQMRIGLEARYMKVATMQDAPADPAVPLPSRTGNPPDQELMNIIAAYETAKATGFEMRISMEKAIRHGQPKSI